MSKISLSFNVLLYLLPGVILAHSLYSCGSPPPPAIFKNKTDKYMFRDKYTFQ